MRHQLSDDERQTKRNVFEEWLIGFDALLADWLESLPNTLKEELDYSPASLLPLEVAMLEKFPDARSILLPENSLMHDGVAIYFGETVRKTMGGEWSIVLDDPENVYFLRPIFCPADGRTAICPHALVTTMLDRRKGSFLHDLFARRLNRASGSG